MPKIKMYSRGCHLLLDIKLKTPLASVDAAVEVGSWLKKITRNALGT